MGAVTPIQEVVTYFSKKASTYDEVDKQVYWRLSDRLLWHLLMKNVVPNVPAGARILDIGGGTGRWLDRLLRALPDASGVLVDVTPAMLTEARRKALAAGYSNRLKLCESRIEDFRPADQFDLAICFHNVLGFVEDPRAVVKATVRWLRPPGQVAIVAPSVYHLSYFALKNGNLDEAEKALKLSRGRFTDDMPEMHLFRPEDLLTYLREAGATTAKISGFPVLIYPGIAETQTAASSGHIVDLLHDSEASDRVFELEVALAANPDLASRGNNLFAWGTASLG